MRFRDIHRVMRSPGGEGGGGTGTAAPPAKGAEGEQPAGEKKEEAPAGEKTPEEKPGEKPADKGERKTLLDGGEEKPAGEAKKDEKPAVVVPEKYELKLPTKSPLSAPVLERTAATARELGLSNEAAQKMLDFVNQETASHFEAVVQSARPGGAAWEKQLDDFEQQASADPEIGGAKLQENIVLARKVADKFFPKAIKQILHETGFGSHPDLIRALAKIGRSMSEDTLIVAHGDGAGGGKQPIEDRWYKNSTSKKE